MRPDGDTSSSGDSFEISIRAQHGDDIPNRVGCRNPESTRVAPPRLSGAPSAGCQTCPRDGRRHLARCSRGTAPWHFGTFGCHWWGPAPWWAGPTTSDDWLKQVRHHEARLVPSSRTGRDNTSRWNGQGVMGLDDAKGSRSHRLRS